MRDFLLSQLFFILSIGAHILWCRLRRKATLQLYSFGVIAGIGLLIYTYITLGMFYRLEYVFDQGIWKTSLWVSSVVIYILMIPTYVIIYFNTLVQSPSKTILVLIKRHGRLSVDDLAKSITDEKFVMTRMKDLLDYGYAKEERGLYALTAKGVLLAKGLKLYEMIFARPMGG